ncbi:hypothetical protein BAE44_0017410 [Dichanthelium oligosanthes]|uniref:Uncharacterized protein n=1 Tax=Dichanthelium oligosanthes TaxID=888268 RepID=A0A1E5V962_9POAL|nr:hypothetical protein BAE44_0017410 [Dichanthelium oligosanthes]
MPTPRTSSPSSKASPGRTPLPRQGRVRQRRRRRTGACTAKSAAWEHLEEGAPWIPCPP